jgi:hypothetical protein
MLAPRPSVCFPSLGLATALGVVVALAGLGGCNDDGAYQVSWGFGVAAVAEAAAAGCGAHGVDAIGISASDGHGNSDSTEIVCTAGQITRSVKAGTWQVTAVALDVRGAQISSIPNATGTAVVEDGKTTVTTPQTLVLTPPSECSDGVDNDGDGRIDADDPDCAAGSLTE